MEDSAVDFEMDPIVTRIATDLVELEQENITLRSQLKLLEARHMATEHKPGDDNKEKPGEGKPPDKPGGQHERSEPPTQKPPPSRPPSGPSGGSRR